MKKFPAMLLATTVGVFTLSGCASPPANQQSVSMGGMAGSDGDTKLMCEEYKKMTSATLPADEKAMMAIRMKDMTPEMREKYMKDMKQCK